MAADQFECAHQAATDDERDAEYGADEDRERQYSGFTCGHRLSCVGMRVAYEQALALFGDLRRKPYADLVARAPRIDKALLAAPGFYEQRLLPLIVQRDLGGVVDDP